MATHTPAPPRLISTYGASSKPTSGGWETISWYFFRISGVALIFLVIFHLLLMHVINDVSATTYCFVAARYQDPFWRVYDLLLLTLALPHGLNGVRIICEDYIGSRGWRLAVESTLFLLALTFWLTGTLTIITFQPAAGACPGLHALIR
ncbi:MAG TPA: succinate dehydrogenase [Ktedonobacterales bacterium]|jgi:succinate dehydrogenase / fumarate reductase, membrane anchor subunit|nr:succinate dehydrogenase [Ktedonobacterales bacterium]